MFYSEMSKDLLKIFNKKDEECQVKALRTQDASGNQESEETVEEVKEEAPKVKASLDDSKPLDLAALMKKKAKKAKDTRKAKKGKKGAPPSKPAPAKAATEAKAD